MTLPQFDCHRDAVALMRAASNEDAAMANTIFELPVEYDTEQFLNALGQLATHAFHADPDEGFDRFANNYLAWIDSTETRWIADHTERETDDD